jgi:hypothetical protein
MTETVSKTKLLLARFVVALMLAFIVLGVVLYGVSADVLERIWRNMLDRTGGPMTFRFFLQPIMALIAALYDGVKDARAGRSYYLWTILTDPAKRAGRLHEGLIATARVILLGLGMDVIYQLLVFETFHPGEAGIIALLLAFVPYLLLRGPFTRLASWWWGDRAAKEIR